jgi:hypothetical protein
MAGTREAVLAETEPAASACATQAGKGQPAGLKPLNVRRVFGEFVASGGDLLDLFPRPALAVFRSDAPAWPVIPILALGQSDEVRLEDQWLGVE